MSYFILLDYLNPPGNEGSNLHEGLRIGLIIGDQPWRDSIHWGRRSYRSNICWWKDL